MGKHSAAGKSTTAQYCPGRIGMGGKRRIIFRRQIDNPDFGIIVCTVGAAARTAGAQPPQARGTDPFLQTGCSRGMGSGLPVTPFVMST